MNKKLICILLEDICLIDYEQVYLLFEVLMDMNSFHAINMTDALRSVYALHYKYFN